MNHCECGQHKTPLWRHSTPNSQGPSTSPSQMTKLDNHCWILDSTSRGGVTGANYVLNTVQAVQCSAPAFRPTPQDKEDLEKFLMGIITYVISYDDLTLIYQVKIGSFMSLVRGFNHNLSPCVAYAYHTAVCYVCTHTCTLYVHVHVLYTSVGSTAGHAICKLWCFSVMTSDPSCLGFTCDDFYTVSLGS